MRTTSLRLSLFILLLLSVCSCSYAQKNQLTPKEFSAQIAGDDIQLLDVRTSEEYEQEHIADATNIDWSSDTFEEETAALDREKPVYIYCKSGNRSAKAAAQLRKAGFKNVYELKGGMAAWERELLLNGPGKKEQKEDEEE